MGRSGLSPRAGPSVLNPDLQFRSQTKCILAQPSRPSIPARGARSPTCVSTCTPRATSAPAVDTITAYVAAEGIIDGAPVRPPG